MTHQKQRIPVKGVRVKRAASKESNCHGPELDKDFGSETRELICVQDRAFQCGEGR